MTDEPQPDRMAARRRVHTMQWPHDVCPSLFDGCMCQIPAPHNGNHRCANVHEPIEWTDEQAAQWWKQECKQ